MSDYVKQAIENAFSGKIADMQTNITNALNSKIYDALETQKMEIAKQMFNSEAKETKDDEEDTESDEEDEEGGCNEESLVEKLTKDTPASKVINDFIHSNDPKFKNKSKSERIKMALGAFYGMHDEEVSNEEHLTEDKDWLGKAHGHLKNAETIARLYPKIKDERTRADLNDEFRSHMMGHHEAMMIHHSLADNKQLAHHHSNQYKMYKNPNWEYDRIEPEHDDDDGGYKFNKESCDDKPKAKKIFKKIADKVNTKSDSVWKKIRRK